MSSEQIEINNKYKIFLEIDNNFLCYYEILYYMFPKKLEHVVVTNIGSMFRVDFYSDC